MATTKLVYIKRRSGGKEPIPEPEPEEDEAVEPFMSIETMIQEPKFIKRKVFIENNPNLGTDRIEINQVNATEGGVGFRNIVEAEGITFFTYKPRALISKPFGDVFVRGVNGAKGVLRQNVIVNAVLNDASENGIYPFKKPLGFKRVFPDRCISFAQDPIDYNRVDGEGDTILDSSSNYFKDIHVLTYKITNKSLVDVAYTYDEGYEVMLEKKYFDVDSRGFGSDRIIDPLTGRITYTRYHTYFGDYLNYITNGTDEINSVYWTFRQDDPYLQLAYKILRTFTLGFFNAFYEKTKSSGGSTLSEAVFTSDNGDDKRIKIDITTGQYLADHPEMNGITMGSFNTILQNFKNYFLESNVFGDDDDLTYTNYANVFAGQRLSTIKIKNTAKTNLFPNEYNYSRGFANNINLHNRVGTLKFSVYNNMPSAFPDGPQINSYLIIPPPDYVAIGSAVTYPNFGLETLSVDDYACVHKDYISHYNSYYNQYISYRGIPSTYNGKKVNKIRDNESYMYHNRNIILYESVDRYFLPHKIKKMIEWSGSDSQLNIYLGGNDYAHYPPMKSGFSVLQQQNDPYYHLYGAYSSPIMIPIIDTNKIKLTNDIHCCTNYSDTEPSNYSPLHIVTITSNDVETVMHTRELNDAPISSRKRLALKAGLIALNIAIAVAVSVASAGAASLASGALSAFMTATVTGAAGAAAGQAVQKVATKAATDTVKQTVKTGLKKFAKGVGNALEEGADTAASELQDAVTSVCQEAANPSQIFSTGNNDTGAPCCRDVIFGRLTTKYFYKYNNGEENRIYPFGDVVDVVNNIINPTGIKWYGSQYNSSGQKDEVELHMLDYVVRKYSIVNKYHTKHAYMMPLIKNVTAFPIGFELAWTFQEADDDLRHFPFNYTEQISDLSGSNLKTNNLSSKATPFEFQRDEYAGQFESQYRSLLKVDTYESAIQKIKNQTKGTTAQTNERTRTISVYRIIPPPGYLALGCAVITSVNLEGYFNVPNRYDYVCVKSEYCLPVNPIKIWDSMHVATKNLVGMFTTVEPYFIPGINGTTDPTSTSSPNYDYTLNTEFFQVMEPIHGMYDTTDLENTIYKRHIYLNVQDLRLPGDAYDAIPSKNRNMMKNNFFREIKEFNGGNDIYYINYPSPHTIMLPNILQDDTPQNFTFVYTGRCLDFSRVNEIREFQTDLSRNLPFLKVVNNEYVSEYISENENTDTLNSVLDTSSANLNNVNSFNIIMNFADSENDVTGVSTYSDISLTDLSGLKFIVEPTYVNSKEESIYKNYMSDGQLGLREFIYNSKNESYLESNSGTLSELYFSLRTDSSYITAVPMFLGYQYTARGYKIKCPTYTNMFKRYIIYIKKQYNQVTSKYTWYLSFYEKPRLDTPLVDWQLYNTYTAGAINNTPHTNKCAINESGIISCAVDHSNNYIIIGRLKTARVVKKGSQGSYIHDIAMSGNNIVFAVSYLDNKANIHLEKYNGSDWNQSVNMLSPSDRSYFTLSATDSNTIGRVLRIDIKENNVVLASPFVNNECGGFKVYDLSNTSLILKTTVTNDVSGTGFANAVAMSKNYMVVGVKDYNLGPKPLGTNLLTITDSSSVLTSVWSKTNSYIASGGLSNKVKIWNSSTGASVKDLSGHTQRVTTLDFSFDDTKIVSGSFDSDVILWDVSSGTVLHKWSDLDDVVKKVKFSPNGEYVAACCGTSVIKIWSVTTKQLIRTISDPSTFIDAFDYSPDGTKIVSSSVTSDNTINIKLWSASTGVLLNQVNSGHTGVIINGLEYFQMRSLEFSQDGNYIVSSANNIKVWNLSNLTLHRTLSGHTDLINNASISPNSKYIISSSDDNTSKLWDISSTSVIYNYTGHGSSDINYAKFNLTGNAVLTCADNGEIKTWASDPSPIFQKIGQVILYKKDTSGNWNQWQTINAPDDLKTGFYNTNGSPKDLSNISLNFGFSVSMTDNYLAVSAPPYNETRGAVVVYKKNKTTNMFLLEQIIYGSTQTLYNFLSGGIVSTVKTSLYSNKEISNTMGFGSQIKISDRSLAILMPSYEFGPTISFTMVSTGYYISNLSLYGNEKGTWNIIKSVLNTVLQPSNPSSIQLKNGNYTNGLSIGFNDNYGVFSRDNNETTDIEHYSYENIYRP